MATNFTINDIGAISALAKAMAMLPLCGVGFQNALGALSPPEVAVQLEWNGGIRVNGAACGALRMMASTTNPAAVPDWLVVGFTLPLYPANDPDMAQTGLNPDQTALYAEGCAEVQPPALVESWARHTLHWINRWEDLGPASLHPYQLSRPEYRLLQYASGQPHHRKTRCRHQNPDECE